MSGANSEMSMPKDIRNHKEGESPDLKLMNKHNPGEIITL